MHSRMLRVYRNPVSVSPAKVKSSSGELVQIKAVCKFSMQSEPCQHQLNAVVLVYALRFYVEIREAIQGNFIASIVPFSAFFLIKADGRRG